MLCKKCNTECFIDRTETIVEGDNSPDTETKVYKNLIYVCRNPKCTEFKKDIGEEKILIYPMLNK